jgi:Right handed beta helix region
MTAKCIAAFFLTTAAHAAPVVVKNDAELRAALSGIKAGAFIRIAPGIYQPGLFVKDAHGTAAQPIVIEALDAARPPVFEGGNQAWHLSDVSHLSLRHIHCRRQKHNGINLDDGGSAETPSHHVTFEGIHIEDVGPEGNFDGIKCSGVDYLRIVDCQVTGWGGQAIDFVGCHHAEIARCRISGKAGFSQHTGPQFKGGSSDVWIHHCRLENAGQRPIQAGGSTGFEFFRPKDAGFEARNIRIEDNLIIGSPCAVAFTGADQSKFIHNTIIKPEKWVMRILQETRDSRFVVCGQNVFSNNLIVFERSAIRDVANIGPGTKADTFTFSGNHWFAQDDPSRSEPVLPAKETNASHGSNPQLDPTTFRPGVALTAGTRSTP